MEPKVIAKRGRVSLQLIDGKKCIVIPSTGSEGKSGQDYQDIMALLGEAEGIVLTADEEPKPVTECMDPKELRAMLRDPETVVGFAPHIGDKVHHAQALMELSDLRRIVTRQRQVIMVMTLLFLAILILRVLNVLLGI